MSHRVDQFIAKIKMAFPTSVFYPIDIEKLDAIDQKYPGMPEDLKELYQGLGYGSIGDSRYSVHFLLEPNEIYDDETAEELKGKLIVGDDFAGNCDAFDAANG